MAFALGWPVPSMGWAERPQAVAIVTGTSWAELIDGILVVMRDCWDLPADCNEGELFTYAEELFDRIEADDPPDALYAYLDEVQTDKLEMAKSSAFREIVDRSVALVRDPA
jgi:hypothetical protein